MGRIFKTGIGITCLVVAAAFTAVVLWWAHFRFWLPHFHEDAKGDLVSGKTKLVLVTQLLPGDKSGIIVPDSIPFWDSIGFVDGTMGGKLWKFSENGKQYVLYEVNTEMPWQSVYEYASPTSETGV